MNKTDTWNRTSLMVAAKKGHYEMIKVLINTGADVNLERSDFVHQVCSRLKMAKVAV